MSDTNDMRSKFEALLKQESLPLVPECGERLNNGDYRSSWSQSNWVFFQAGAASMQDEQEPYSFHYRSPEKDTNIIGDEDWCQARVEENGGDYVPLYEHAAVPQGEQQPVARFSIQDLLRLHDQNNGDWCRIARAVEDHYLAAHVPQGGQCHNVFPGFSFMLDLDSALRSEGAIDAAQPKDAQ